MTDPTFRDTAGRTWTLAAGYGALGRVEAACGVSLFKLMPAGRIRLRGLLSDPERLAGVLYELVRVEAEAAGVAREEFVAGLLSDGEARWRGAEALVEALADRCRDVMLRGALGQIADVRAAR